MVWPSCSELAGHRPGANYPAYSTTRFANPVASNQTNTASGLKLLGLIS